MALMRSRENYWLQYRSGGIDEATWDTFRMPVQISISSPIGRTLFDTGIASGGGAPLGAMGCR